MKLMYNFIIKTLVILITLFNTMDDSFSKNKGIIKKITKPEEEWKKLLTPKQFHILREKGTDKPSEKGYTNHFEKGTYHCAACNLKLFKSGSKFKSHCGWPSFDDAIKGTIIYKKDTSFGMIRTEILCARCEGHLGHIFDDGPKETTGKRFCVNTTSIKFVKQK